MEYAKVSIPRPLFDQLKNDPRIAAKGFRSPTDAAIHAIRVFIADDKGAA